MEGYVDKWTNSIRGWQERYIVIKNGEFRYYRKKGEKVKGLFSLENSRVEMVNQEPLRITLNFSDNNQIILRCKTLADKAKWVNALCTTQQPNDPDSIQKDEILDSIVTDDMKLLKNELMNLFQNRILSNASKLNAYVTQVWTFQGLLEAALSDFSEDLIKIVAPPNTLKESADNIKRYTTELKVIYNK